MGVTSQINDKFTTSQAGYCTQQSTSTHTALSVLRVFFQHLDYKNVYEGKANLIYISIHVFRNCVVLVLKAR